MYSRQCAVVIGCLVAMGGHAKAQPSAPVYSTRFADCITGDNQFATGEGLRWDVDPGCDIYQQEIYERPVTQEFRFFGTRYGSKEYFEYLDIEGARAGIDDRFLYVAIDLYGRDNITSGGTRIEIGMAERYGFRLSNDPDGRFGVLLVSDQPELKMDPPTRFGSIGVHGYRDTDGDVGGAASSGPSGLTITKTDNPNEEDGLNGYDEVIISDGVLEVTSERVAWARLSPADDTVVELAVDYRAIGFTREDLENLAQFDIEAVKGGPKDPQNYLWNDKYTKLEAGSPNPGTGGRSEFETEGLENIYEVDTVRGGPISAVSCYADCDFNGILNVLDFLCFQDAFVVGDPSADCDGSGRLNVFDFLCFQDAFQSGCP